MDKEKILAIKRKIMSELEKERMKQGITRKELSNMTGYGRLIILYQETNRREDIFFMTLLTWADALNVDLPSLMRRVYDELNT